MKSRPPSLKPYQLRPEIVSGFSVIEAVVVDGWEYVHAKRREIYVRLCVNGRCITIKTRVPR